MTFSNRAGTSVAPVEIDVDASDLLPKCWSRSTPKFTRNRQIYNNYKNLVWWARQGSNL